MKRKQKMRQVQHRVAWRDVPCVVSWYQKKDGAEDWEHRSNPISVQMTRSGKLRTPTPLLTVEFNGLVGHLTVTQS